MPNAGINRTTSSEVAANGSASVTHRRDGERHDAEACLAGGGERNEIAARWSGAGVGSRWIANSSAVAASRMSSLRSRRWAPGSDSPVRKDRFRRVRKDPAYSVGIKRVHPKSSDARPAECRSRDARWK
jgi:hypothetical protein